MYQMKPFRFVDFSENMYVCHDIGYKILELDDKRINFKNFGIEICSGRRIWVDYAVIGLRNF